MDGPLKKRVEPEDPMELRGVAFHGDPDFMIDCIVEEYARLGWSPAKILPLFESPSYPVLHGLYRTRGAESIRRSVEEVVRRCGVFHFDTHERPPDLELVQIKPAETGGSQDE